MTQDEIAKAVEAYQANGGTITKLPTGIAQNVALNPVTKRTAKRDQRAGRILRILQDGADFYQAHSWSRVGTSTMADTIGHLFTSKVPVMDGDARAAEAAREDFLRYAKRTHPSHVVRFL